MHEKIQIRDKKQQEFWKIINLNQYFYNLKNGTDGSIVTSKHKMIYFIGQWCYGIEYWKYYIIKQETCLWPKIVHRKKRFYQKIKMKKRAKHIMCLMKRHLSKEYLTKEWDLLVTTELVQINSFAMFRGKIMAKLRLNSITLREQIKVSLSRKKKD